MLRFGVQIGVKSQTQNCYKTCPYDENTVKTLRNVTKMTLKMLHFGV